MDIQIANKNIENTYNALNALEGANPGSPDFVPYEFSNSSVTYAIIYNLRKLKPLAEDMANLRQKILRGLKITGQNEILDGDNAEKFLAQIGPSWDEIKTVTIRTIDYDDLRVLNNRIPKRVIEAMGDMVPMTEDFVPAAEPIKPKVEKAAPAAPATPAPTETPKP